MKIVMDIVMIAGLILFLFFIFNGYHQSKRKDDK